MGSSKKYQGKLCVYCRRNIAATVDHIFPREMFQLNQRNMLPKVPSCAECNNNKSKLEHYLLSVLPFGATDTDAKQRLAVDVSRRLSKNRKLHKIITDGHGYKYAFTGSIFERRMYVPLDADILHNFIGFVGMGLTWHHWKKYLPLEYSFRVFTPSKNGIDFLDYLFNLSTRHRAKFSFGNDTVKYKGVISEEDEGITIWVIQLFGGMTVADELSGCMFKNSFAAMISGKPELIENFLP